MGPEGAVNIVFRKEIEGVQDRAKEIQRLTREYRATFANPWKAAELGYVDAVILPQDTRPTLITALEMLKGKRDKNLRKTREHPTLRLNYV
jgi:propionyl-CoA carboxylase beta chain